MIGVAAQVVQFIGVVFEVVEDGRGIVVVGVTFPGACADHARGGAFYSQVFAECFVGVVAWSSPCKQGPERVPVNVWHGIAICHVEQGGTNVHEIAYLVVFRIWDDRAGQACDEGDADGAFVITAFPPAAVFSGHFAVVRAINDQGVAVEARFAQGLEDVPDLQVEVFAHAKISGAGNADAFFVEGGIEAAKLFEFANGCGFIGRVLGNIYAVVIIIKKLFVRDEGTVGQEKSRHGSKGAVAGISRFVAQIRAGSFRDHFVKDVIRAISPSGDFHGRAILSGGRG